MLTKCGLGEAGKRSVFVVCAGRGRTRPPNGKGTLYLGFHLDPLDRVHSNNEVDPVAFSIQAPEGVTVTPARGAAIDPEEPADADPREFVVEVDGPPGAVLDLTVRYFACDDVLTFCVPVRQAYDVVLERDWNHDWSVRTDADGDWKLEVPRVPVQDDEGAAPGEG